VRFLVIGRDPAPSIVALAGSMPGMSLSGTVDDVLPWLQQVDILVSPLKIGAGTKLKVAEAMACAIPVVGSALAFAGLDGRSGEHYVVARDGPDFVAAVARLARSAVEREEIGRRARALAIRDLDWRGIGDRLSADIAGALGRN
jgi:glycosyltransferase involved in cell wall biosynthesis